MISFAPHASLVALENGYLVVTLKNQQPRAVACLTLEGALAVAAERLGEAQQEIRSSGASAATPGVRIQEQHLSDVAKVLKVPISQVRDALRSQLGISPFSVGEEEET